MAICNIEWVFGKKMEFHSGSNHGLLRQENLVSENGSTIY